MKHSKKFFSTSIEPFFARSKKYLPNHPQKEQKMRSLTHSFNTTHSASFFPALPFDEPLHIWEVGSLGFMRIHQFLFWLGLSFNPLGSVKSYEQSLNFETQFFRYILQSFPFPQNVITKYKASRGKKKKKSLVYETTAIQVKELTQWEAIESMRGVL